MPDFDAELLAALDAFIASVRASAALSAAAIEEGMTVMLCIGEQLE